MVFSAVFLLLKIPLYNYYTYIDNWLWLLLIIIAIIIYNDKNNNNSNHKNNNI